MKNPNYIPDKVVTLDKAVQIIAGWRLLNRTVAFTNGCFDILHEGHIYSLSQAAKECNYLIVGINSDSSVKRLKGNNRPVNHQHSRALIVASLIMVDLVILFEEDTPLALINTLKPNVLVKGGDYTVDTIVGAKDVISNGGRVVINPIIKGFSTTNLIQKMKTLQ